MMQNCSMLTVCLRWVNKGPLPMFYSPVIIYELIIRIKNDIVTPTTKLREEIIILYIHFPPQVDN